MNARILLLVIITGLFMAAWDGDQTAMQAAVARRDLRNAERLAVASAVDMARSNPVRTVSAHEPLPNVTAAAENAPTAEPSIAADAVPRPATIAPGTYQAVSQDGATLRIVVPVGSNASAAVREFYTVDAEDGNRWYLIRVATADQ
ncbi:MAG: hypothetical protein R3C49_20280 [Planctomycetaceae bacterium]